MSESVLFLILVWSPTFKCAVQSLHTVALKEVISGGMNTLLVYKTFIEQIAFRNHYLLAQSCVVWP